MDNVELNWSPVSGAYEVHLRRRFRNPFFAPERQFVKQSDVDEARALDAKELDVLTSSIANL